MTKMTSKVVISTLLLLAAFSQEVNCQCDPLGTNVETQFTAVRSLRFYLNTAYPAPCSGTIQRWRYCYYKPSNTGDNNYRAIAAVYRRMVSSSGSVHYGRVSNVFTILRRRNAVRNNGDFVCDTCDTTNPRDFEIQAGDVIGVCIFDPSDNRNVRSQLDIVGQMNGSSLMEMSDVTECTPRTIPSNISSSQLSEVSDRILHLYAEIANPVIPTDPPTTTHFTTEPTTTATATVTWTTTQTSDVNVTIVNTPPITTGSTSSPDTTTEPVSTTVTDTSMPSESPATTTVATSDPTTSDEPTTTSAAPTTIISEQPATTVSVGPVTTKGEATTTTSSITEEATSMTLGTFTITSEADTQSSSTEKGMSTTVTANVEAQASGSLGIEGITGVSIVAALTVVVTLALIVIAVIVSRKRGHKSRQYSPSGAGASQLDNSVQVLTGNGVDNLTYDTVSGFVNPGASLDTSYSLYDQVTKTDDTPAGEGNYCMLEESTFSNTYESVSADMYSEIKKPVVQVNHSHDHIIGGSYFENENIYSSPEESNGSLSYLLERNKQEDIYGNLDAYHAPASDEYEIYSQLTTCGVVNISHSHITITGHLGSGQFGNVERGTWQSNKGVEVALKTLKEGSSELDKVKFLQEAAIMAQFRHPNIVTLHGVVSDKEPIMLVVEMMHGGDLREFLNSIRPDPGELPRADLPEMLLNFSQHVAFGMQYLSGKGFVHRDIAARNILVSNHNICKVADFGMSRDLDDENYYISHGGKVPVKWTAPEAIHYRKYSTASDVWSYGCLLYEIWSLGHKPFEASTNIEVVKLIDSNKRLPPPPGCPRTVYELMIRCWHPATGSRPRFRDLTIILTGDRSDVLSIPQEALSTHKLAGVLAAALEVGKDMYTDLQNRYITSE